MPMPKTVTLTRDGGHYWRAQAFRLSIAWTTLPVVLLVLGFAYINPFWFREQFFNWAINTLNSYSGWLSYRQYSIYLGMDPKVWHTMKGDIK